jgi:dimeric dUTPase (all-alpha-NTP-PPase superfamily)
MQMLNKMLTKQKEFQDRLDTLNFKSPQDRTRFIREHAQYVDAELHELLRELPCFKPWKSYTWTATELVEHENNAKEEFIDALHFMLNIALALGMSAEDIYNEYMRKNKINHDRQDNAY